MTAPVCDFSIHCEMRVGCFWVPVIEPEASEVPRADGGVARRRSGDLEGHHRMDPFLFFTTGTRIPATHCLQRLGQKQPSVAEGSKALQLVLSSVGSRQAARGQP